MTITSRLETRKDARAICVRLMFERYLNDPESTPSDELKTEIWIPIE